MDPIPHRSPITYEPQGGRSYHRLQDEIEKRSFEIYLDRVHTGRPGGALDDWLRAEAEVCARFGLSSRPLSRW